MNIQNEVSQIEKDLLILITLQLEKKEMTQTEAQQLAKDFLKVLPVKDQEDLMQKLKTLAIEHSDAKPIYLAEKNKIFNENKEEILSQISQMIKDGEIENAINFLKEQTTEEII